MVFESETTASKAACSKGVRFKLDELLDSLEFLEKKVVKSTERSIDFVMTIQSFCNASST